MSEEKEGRLEKRRDRPVQLHDSGLRAGSIIDTAVRSLDADQSKAIIAKASEEAVRLEVKNREQQMDYVAGHQAMNDHVDAFNALEKTGKLTRQKVVSDFKTGAGNMKIESKSGANCFVATAAYGGEGHPNVQFLRGYRDAHLVNTRLGRVFIKFYWIVGPLMARPVRRSRILQKTSQAVIAQIVSYIKTRKKFE